MVDLWKMCLLAVVQGIAEFLPVSSSGHLTVLQAILGWDPDKIMLTDVNLHAGTLLAILIFYFRELWSLRLPEKWRVIGLVAAGSVPAAVVGLSIKISGAADLFFNYPIVSGFGFLVTATVLLIGMKGAATTGEGTALDKLRLVDAVIIGCAQAIAILPGVSRSGSTIAAALKCGVRKEDCATFSFLLAIPAIGGATMIEMLSAWKKGHLIFTYREIMPMAIGFVISAAVGYLALTLLLQVLRKGKLGWFSAYLYVLGAVVIVGSLIAYGR